MVVIGLFAASTALAEEAENDAEDRPQMDGLTGGDTPWERAYDRAMLDGREYYNADEREAARDAFVRAVQILPGNAAAYRNLARNYNLMGEYADAAHYYDEYLRLAPDADDREVISRERRGAAARGGDEPWTVPADQRMARRALQREIDDGRGLTDGGGGAWGLFGTLMGTGYAAPDIEDLRRQVEQKLLDELEEEFRPRDGFLPVLDRDGWALQGQRLEALGELARDEASVQFVERRTTLVNAVTSLLDESYEEVVEMTAAARRENPDLAFSGWYRVVALETIGQPGKALEVLDEMVEEEAFEGTALRRVEVVRAKLLQQQNNADEAAKTYRRVLKR